MKVTIYIPTHNRLELLQRAISSVFAQSHSDIELIVVADGCSDGTVNYLKGLEDPRLKFFINEKSRGPAFCRNLAINNASSEYITGLDDDDYFAPEHVAKFIKAIDSKYSFLCTGFQYVTCKSTRNLHEQKMIITKNDILVRNFVGNQVFIKTELLRNVEGFDENLTAWEDYDLWTRLVLKYGSAKRIEGCSYIMDVSHIQNRITSSPKNSLGAQEYLERYSKDMSPSQFAVQKVHIAHLTKSKIAFNLMLKSVCCKHPIYALRNLARYLIK